MKKIFGEYFFVEGLKKLILKSTNSELKILHLATPNDILLNKLDNNYKQKIYNKNIKSPKYEIMFCLDKSNPYIKKLKKININKVSVMSVYGFNNSDIKWDFIRTYMI